MIMMMMTVMMVIDDDDEYENESKTVRECKGNWEIKMEKKECSTLGRLTIKSNMARHFRNHQ